MNIDHFYDGLGAAFAAGEPGQIRGYLKSSLAQAEAEDDRHAVISILNELMGFYRNTSRYAEAIKAAERALAEMRNLGYEDTVHYGTTLLNSATVHRACGNNVEALEQFIAALAIYQANLPDDDYRLAGVYNNVSSIYEQNGQNADALQSLQKALDILLKNEGARDEAAIVQTNLAMVLFKMNHEAEAISELELAMELFKPDGGMPWNKKKPGPQYAAALAGVGEAYFRMKKFDEAVMMYEDALAHINSVFGKNRDYSVTCSNCALAYAELGDKAKAAEYTTLADSIVKELGLSEENL